MTAHVCNIPGYKVCPMCKGSGNRVVVRESHRCECCGMKINDGWEMSGEGGFHRVCLACRDDIKHGGHYENSEWIPAEIKNCHACEGEGTVVDEDAVCESCLEAGKVREYDIERSYGTRLCVDCADARDDIQEGD